MEKVDRRIAAGLFALAWITFAWFFGGAGWNQDAHFDLTRAIVERHTLYIDGYDVNTGDVSRGVGGHVYINKTPGVSFLAVIPYAIVFGVERVSRLPVDRLEYANEWIVTALTCGLCGALIGPVLFLYGRRKLGASAGVSLSVAYTILFGTIVFAYATMLFAHVPAALFLLIAVTTYEERPLIAGAAAGLAVTCFYVCAVPAAILLIASRKNALRFIAGAAPFALLLGAYQWACFGSPFTTAVEISAPFTETGRLFGVLGLPTLESIYGITFSPYRGLFAASPALLLAFIGFFRMKRRDAVVLGAICVLFFLAIASFNGWSGGWAFGPRYLLPIVPLLGIPLMRAPRAIRGIFIVAAFASIVINFTAAATDSMPSPEVRNPITRYILPAFFTGRIPEETRRAYEWYGTVYVDKVSLPREARNLGELMFGAGKRASVVPIVLLWIAGSAVLFRLARDPAAAEA